MHFWQFSVRDCRVRTQSRVVGAWFVFCIYTGGIDAAVFSQLTADAADDMSTDDVPVPRVAP